MMHPLKLSGGLALALMVATSSVGAAGTPPAPEQPSNPWTVVQRMTQRNPSLQSYRARVHVDVRMLNFPFLAPKLDGTEYYKRPDFYVVVFDRMPSYARGFQRLFDDIGNPRAWEKNQNITVDGTSLLRRPADDRPAPDQEDSQRHPRPHARLCGSLRLRAIADGVVLHERRQDHDDAAVPQRGRSIRCSRSSTPRSTSRTCTPSPTRRMARIKPTFRSA